MRTRTMIMILAFTSILSSGCGTYRYKAYDGPTLPDSEIATIVTDSRVEVQIARVDGKKTLSVLDFMLWGKWPGIVYVKPGPHEIVPCFSTPYYELYNGTLNIDAQAGRTYMVKHKLEEVKNVTFWIEDVKLLEQQATK
jgi:hypothetical protein